MKCNKNTSRCPIDPFKKGHILNECCRENLMHIIFEIPDILDGNRWWLDFGTLLGFYRDGRIIDHDSDLDIGIIYDDFYKNKNKIERLVKEKGLFLTKISDNFFRINLSKINKLHCDLFLFKKNNDIYETHFSEYLSKHDEIFPIRETLFFNKYFNTPNNIEYFLETRYGDSWNIPISRGDGYKPIKRNI